MPEPVPPAAGEIFGSRLPTLAAYAQLLVTEGVIRGLLGPREGDRIWERHLLNSAVLLPLIPTGASVVDLGSGAGLPGLVVAAARPDLAVTLVEPLQRRVSFLSVCVAELGLTHVQIQRARAEDLVGHPRFDVVTARALRRLVALVPLAVPLLLDGGRMLAIKGEQAAVEIEEATGVLAKSGMTAQIIDRRAGAAPGLVVVAERARSGERGRRR